MAGLSRPRALGAGLGCVWQTPGDVQGRWSALWLLMRIRAELCTATKCRQRHVAPGASRRQHGMTGRQVFPTVWRTRCLHQACPCFDRHTGQHAFALYRLQAVQFGTLPSKTAAAGWHAADVEQTVKGMRVVWQGRCLMRCSDWAVLLSAVLQQLSFRQQRGAASWAPRRPVGQHCRHRGSGGYAEG